MQSAQNTGYEHAIMLFYVRHITVALPLTILIIKIVVRFVTREPAKDIFRSVLVLPLDLVYVAFGLLLAGMARRIPAFAIHYQTDKEADFAGIVLCLVLFVAACLITWFDRFIRLLWQKFYAAWNLSKPVHADGDQMVLPTQTEPVIRKAAIIYLWMFTYWAMMIPCIFLEVVISVEALGSILKRLQ
jgi:hypothetical protein